MRRLVLAAAVGIVTVLATPWVDAAGAAPITVIGGTAFDLPPDSTVAQTITIPVLLAPKTAKPALRVVDVTEGQSRKPAQLAAVRAKYDPPSQSIGLTVAARQLTDAAIYTVDVLATSTGSAPQAIAITLTRPSAVLDSVPTVTLSRTRSYWWTADSVQNGMLTVTETSGRTTLHDVTFQQTQNVPGGGQVRIDSTARSTIAAGGHVTYTVRTSGHFALDATSVTMRLRSPQLTTPITFTVDVTQRVSRGWLVGVAAIGAVVAFLLNDLVVSWRSRGNAKRTAGELKDKMAAMMPKYRDPVLVAALQNQISSLDQAIAHHVSTLPTVVDEVQKALTKAQQDYEASRIDAAAQINTLRTALAPSSGQPRTIRDVLTALQATVTAAKGELDDGKPTVAVTALTTSKATVAVDLAAAVTSWRSGVRGNLDSLASNLDVPDRLQVAAGVLLGQLDTPPLIEPDGLEPADLLVALDHLRDRLVDALVPVRLWRSRALVAVEELRSRSSIAEVPIDELEAAATALPTAVDLETVEATLDEVVAAAPPLQQAAVRAMVTPLSAVRSAATRHVAEATVTDRLRAGLYDSAASIAADALPRPQVKALGANDRARKPGVLTDTLGYVAADVTRDRGVREAAAPEPAVGLVVDLWHSSTALRVRGWVDLGASRLAQALLTAIVAVVLVVSLFGADWIGTWSDLAKVFFWGFTVNLSTGALTKAASAVVPSPSTG